MADCTTFMRETDSWLRRRIRMCIWKMWKKTKTRYINLMKCGIPKYKAYMWSYTKGYWRVAGSWVLTTSITNARLQRQGYPSIEDSMLRLRKK